MNCLTVLTARIIGAGAHIQPIFQPVTLNVLPALDTLTVRSCMPGNVAIGTWTVSSKVRCS